MNTPSSDSSSLQTISYEQNTPTFSYIMDIFLAYGLCPSSLNETEISKIIDNISQVKKTYPFLLEAVNSNRYPYTIMNISAKFGMFIPPRKRIGLDAYNFFLNNVKYYESTFDRVSQQVPNLYEIYMANDKLNLLMKFRDDEILKHPYQFTRNYANRKDMIQSFIDNNITIHGQFSLNINTRKVYGSKAKVISYQESGKSSREYSIDEFYLLIDHQRRLIWKDSQGFLNPSDQNAFSRLSLHHLRQQILEKSNQWKNRDSAVQYNGPPELYNILIILENLLINDARNDLSAYLGCPMLI
jgi:hypothetical protein